MSFDEIVNIVNSATCPESFASDMNVGDYVDGKSRLICEYYPSEESSDYSHIDEVQDCAQIALHTHGVEIDIDGKNLLIHESQIILVDYYHFDDTIEYNRSDSRGNRVALGSLLGGPVIGAAIGFATSFGKGHKHIVSDNLVVAYWNKDSKRLETITLEMRKKEEIERGSVSKLIDLWHREQKINKETARKPTGGYIAGASSSGCLVFFALIIPGMYAAFSIIKNIIC